MTATQEAVIYLLAHLEANTTLTSVKEKSGALLEAVVHESQPLHLRIIGALARAARAKEGAAE